MIFTWLKKLVEFQGDGIGCEGSKQNTETVGNQGLKEEGVSLQHRKMWEVKKKFQKLFEGI